MDFNTLFEFGSGVSTTPTTQVQAADMLSLIAGNWNVPACSGSVGINFTSNLIKSGPVLLEFEQMDMNYFCPDHENSQKGKSYLSAYTP
jgi:hypothetical protein